MKFYANFWVTLLILLALAGGGLYWQLQQAGAPVAPAPSPSGEKAPPALAVLPLEAKTINIAEEAAGRVVAYQSAEIRPQVSGILTERLFTEGGTVKEGQPLYQIDPAVFQAAYASALADWRKAQANKALLEAKNQRYEALVKRDAVSQQQYDDVRTNLALAQAEIAITQAAIAQARINLNYTKVLAPISGRIGKSLVSKGALVTANQAQALATITQLDPLYVDINLPIESLMRLRKQAARLQQVPARLYLGDDAQAYAHEGQVQFHEMVVDESTGTVPLRVQFPNPDTMLLPGQFVRVQLLLAYAQALLIPQKCAERKADGSLSVWVLDAENKAQPMTIQVAQAVGDAWRVVEGLKPGDRLITEGTMNLKAGAPVQPVLPQTTDTGNGG
ncbi:efflux transporter, RND family, MFP subunit [Magnetococcus marinus MC-1]|uniref:Efflux transporter, RND family, MFP subunit n=1 Tax=Magnetococcus marinus (strain ATCC BAA-1437 / JCM 17883 / MC-1) TaxID=156889 RepID=A0LCF9_MAGMM|nr:efflux RND transporter periplasmic adaptor subunit [Magnetococcus marinus]ABK45652.1 efflux transporter, RND family, MFP subunit [Magnetococcus marinus MC-1]